MDDDCAAAALEIAATWERMAELYEQTRWPHDREPPDVLQVAESETDVV
jgi:hypothetical protein